MRRSPRPPHPDDRDYDVKREHGGALYQQACHALARVGAPQVPLATRFRPHQAPLRPPSDADPCSPRHSKSAEDEEEGRSEHELIPLKNGAGSPNKNGVA